MPECCVYIYINEAFPLRINAEEFPRMQEIKFILPSKYVYIVFEYLGETTLERNLSGRRVCVCVCVCASGPSH